MADTVGPGAAESGPPGTGKWALWPDPRSPTPSLYFRHMLGDGDAKRVADMCRDITDPTLRRWVEELLKDRRERVALAVDLCRQVDHLRGRAAQAARYLDKLAAEAYSKAYEPWAQQQPCPVCRAPGTMLRTELRPTGHVLVNEHPDGKVCELPGG